MRALWRVSAGWVVAALLAAPLAAEAQPAPPRPPQQPTVNPLTAPRKAVTDAVAAVALVRAQMAVTRSRVAAQFETKEDWIAAKKALSDAKAHYDAALKPVLAALQANPDYQKLVAHRKASREKLDQLREAPRPSDPDDQKAQDDQLSQAAGDLVNDGYALNKMDTDARSNDSDLGAASEELSDAKKTMEALQAQVTTVLETDPEYIAEQQQLTSAEQQLAEARTALAIAEKPQRTTRQPTTPQANRGP